MNGIVAGNIRRLRASMKLSLDELAQVSGVSKSMLARIERGEGNPTLSTLWKISNGMQVPFDELIARPSRDFTVVRPGDVQPILEDGGRARNYSIFPDGEGRRFAVYMLELEPGSRWTSEAHPRGTTEFITVFEGSLQVDASIRLHRASVLSRRASVKALEHFGEVAGAVEAAVRSRFRNAA